VILVDSNIPMYLVGASHPNKEAARTALERAIVDGDGLVTDAEVLQEILHRYAAIERRDAIGPCMDVVLGVVDEVIAIERADVIAAQRLVERVARLSARDAVHVAVMQRHGIGEILTFDRGFDAVPGIARRPADAAPPSPTGPSRGWRSG
jgi:uncharacterized protein